MNLPLNKFIQTQALAIACIILLVTLPFIVRRYKPQAYQGFLQSMGDLLRSPVYALAIPAGYLIGLVILILILY